MRKKNSVDEKVKNSGGVPFFNVFSRKKIASLMMAGVMIATPIMLAGCSDGKDGANGADGTMWYTGTAQPEESQGKVGDFFYDKATSTIYIKTENGWVSQGSIKGATGSQGIQGEQGAKGDKGDKGDKGNTGATGNGIASITKTGPAEDGLTYTYTIKFTDTSVADYVFTVKNGADAVAPTVTISDDGYWVINGTKTETLAKGTNGTTPTISIDTNGYWVINGITTSTKAEAIDGTNGADGATWLTGPTDPTDTTTANTNDLYLNTTSGDVFKKTSAGWGTAICNIKGATGATGATGNGISSITIDNDSTKTNATQTTYIINFTDNTSYSFVVKNGTNGTNGNDGVSITGITKGPSNGNVDTYTITYSNNTSSTFTVTNGTDGKDGATWLTGTVVGGTTQGSADIVINNTQVDGAKVGDLYFNTNTCDIYTCTETNTWKWLANIKGAQGVQGETGSTGLKGDTGSAGATWLTGTVVGGTTQGSASTEIKDTPVDGAKVGDLYFNTNTCDVYTCIETNTWKWLCNIKGAQGEKGDTGSQGEKGEKGEDGTSVYVGYDGYIWSGKIRTEYKAQIDETDRTDILEDTLGVSNTMKEYFAYGYVDLSSNVIALMQYYKPNAQMTIYGNTKITEIQVVCENAGTLYIGKANVSDIVNARTNGTTLTATTNPYGVNAGLNTITFDTPLELAEGETLVLGGSGSTANLFVAKGIPLDDEVGNFTLVDGNKNTNIISETGEYADTLAIKVKGSGYIKYTQVFKNFATECTAENAKTGVYTTYTPFKYQTSYDSNFSGKTITRFGAYCEANNASNDAQPYMTIYKIKTSTTSYFATNAIDTIKIYFPAGSTAGELVYADCNITLAEDETIAFGKSDDTFVWRFKGVESGGNLKNRDGSDATKAFAAFDIYVSSTEDFATHLATLNKTAKIDTLMSVLSGKNLSILGDSISTFDGYSNDSTNTNSTIGNNYVSYGTSGRDLTLSSVDDTWWKQTADKTGMNVLVNNSYGGSKVSGTSDSSQNALTRAQNLHDDTGDNKGTNPDIIAVYMGINDFINGVTSEAFTTAYDNMISKIRTTYGDNVKIFVFTLVTYGTVGDENTTLLAYNEAIKTIATKYSCVVVDYANSGVNSSNLSTYMQDASLLHPNAQGMDVISDCFWNALYETYVTNATQTQE